MKYDLKLGKLRQAAGYTQAQASEKLGISKSALALYEKNPDNMPLSIFIKMADLYDFDVATVAGVKEESFERDISMYYFIKAHAKYIARRVCINEELYKEHLEQFIYKAIKADNLLNKALMLSEFEKDKEKGIFSDELL